MATQEETKQLLQSTIKEIFDVFGREAAGTEQDNVRQVIIDDLKVSKTLNQTAKDICNLLDEHFKSHSEKLKHVLSPLFDGIKSGVFTLEAIEGEAIQDVTGNKQDKSLLVSDEVLKLLFLSINFEASTKQFTEIRAMLELDLENDSDITAEGSAECICNELNIPIDGNAKKIEAVLIPLWEARDGKPTEDINNQKDSYGERFSAKKTAQIKKMRAELVVMDGEIAEQQRDLNSLREDRKALDLKLLDLIASPDQFDLFDQEQEEARDGKPKNDQLTLPDLNHVTCGICAYRFQLAENQNAIKEGIAFVVATLPEDIGKKFKGHEHICGECYHKVIGRNEE